MQRVGFEAEPIRRKKQSRMGSEVAHGLFVVELLLPGDAVLDPIAAAVAPSQVPPPLHVRARALGIAEIIARTSVVNNLMRNNSDNNNGSHHQCIGTAGIQERVPTTASACASGDRWLV